MWQSKLIENQLVKMPDFGHRTSLPTYFPQVAAAISPHFLGGRSSGHASPSVPGSRPRKRTIERETKWSASHRWLLLGPCRVRC